MFSGAYAMAIKADAGLVGTAVTSGLRCAACHRVRPAMRTLTPRLRLGSSLAADPLYLVKDWRGRTHSCMLGRECRYATSRLRLLGSCYNGWSSGGNYRIPDHSTRGPGDAPPRLGRGPRPARSQCSRATHGRSAWARHCPIQAPARGSAKGFSAANIRGCGSTTCVSRHGLPNKQGREVLEEAMKVSYDSKTDTLSVILKDDVCVAESDEEKPGVILDYDEAGDLISLEILDASKRVTDAKRLEFQFVE